MRIVYLGLASFLLTCLCIAGCGSGGEGDSSESNGESSVQNIDQTGVPVLTHLDTFQMEEGTHRPEIFVLEDGRIVLVVVHPDGSGSEVVKHQAYIYDQEFNQQDRFNVTYIDETYGEPADHRVAIVDDQLVIVYQTLNYDPNTTVTPGPSEQYATDQSLMLARYSLDGEELHRAPIVANQKDFEEDNFPDHCLLWDDDRLLVSTGSWSKTTKIREVDLDGNISQTWAFEGDLDNIGNSLLLHNGKVSLLSYLMGQENGLTLNEFDSDFTPTLIGYFPSEERTRTFPTGFAQINGYTFVSHVTSPAGTFGNPETNPFDTYLLVLDENLNEVEEIKLGETGFGHIHPTIAWQGDRFWVAWSMRSESGTAPQVQIETFELTYE